MYCTACHRFSFRIFVNCYLRQCIISSTSYQQSSMSELAKSETLLAYTDIPPWQQDSYILRGYRPLSYSYIKSAHSLGYLHNQTINIYTHLIGLIFFCLTAYAFQDTLTSRYHTASYEDTIVFSSFFAGIFACLGFSSAFHTFSNHSEAVCQRWLVLDFLGIISLIAGSWVPGVYYGFYCQKGVSSFYVVMVSIIQSVELRRKNWSLIAFKIFSLSAVCATLLLVPHFRTPRWKHFRTAMFLSLGISGFFPMTYAAKEFGVAQAHSQMGWGWIILEAVFYISGALVYASQYPEKAWPGSYDFFGSSHQVFHVLVLLGAIAHFTGIVQAFTYNHNPITRMC